MRTPTPIDDQLLFWRNAIAGRAQAIHEGEPNAGWYQTRLVARGPWVPVRIWLEQPVDDAGELEGPEILRCTVDGEIKDPVAVWVHCADRPIAEHYFAYMAALRSWQKINEPELWDPYQPVDINRTPIEV